MDAGASSNQLNSVPIYRNFSLFLLVVTIITLLPHYDQVTSSEEQVPAGLIIHGVLFLSWYALFYIQSQLVGLGNIAVHKKLGILSVFLGVALFISGVQMLYGVMATGDQSRTSFVWGILHTTLFFFSFVALAVLNRKNPNAHKRLIALASLSMMSASVTRIAYLPIVPIDGTAFTLLSTYVFLAIPILIDKVWLGAVHPVLKWGVPIYAITQIVSVGILPNTEIGRQIAFPF